MTDTPRLTLPAELNILAVGGLMPDWLAWLDGHALHSGSDPRLAVIDAGAVQVVDSAGLQLLVSLGLALEDRGWALRLHGVEGPLEEACASLGLGSWLAARHVASTEQGAVA